MNIRDIYPILVAGAASLGMAATAGAAALQQDLTIPLRPRPTPDDSPEQPEDSDDVPLIRPGSRGRLPLKPFNPPKDLAPQSDQRISVNSQFAGWESASTDSTGDRVENSLRGNWVMVDANGRFEGQVVATGNASSDNMNVFLMHMGRLVKQTTVNEEGRFVFNNVRQGAYALTGWGEQGLFTFGLHVLANNERATDNIPPNSIRVTAFQNQTTINTDWIRHYSPQVGFRVFGKYSEGEGAKNAPALYGSLGLFNNPPENTPATSISSHTVTRTDDDRIVGRVHQLNSISGRPVDLRSTKVLLLENNSVVAATAADSYGVFEFEQVPNGTYGVLAAGVDGVGLIGITVGDEAADSDTIDFTLIPSETVGWLNDYATEVAYRRNIAAPRRPAAPTKQYNGTGCQNCNNQAGGCNECRKKYLESACRTKGITFEQWQTMGCQAYPGGFGQGRFVREMGKTLRDSIDRLDSFSENTFYPNESVNSTLQGLGQAAVGNTQGQLQQSLGPATGQLQGNGFSPAPVIPGSNFGGGSGTR